MTSRTDLHSDLPVPPGEYLEEVIGELGMTKDELARRMARPATKLSAVFAGAKAITPETALQLEKVVGVPAGIWLGLEAEYRLTLARQAEAAQIAKEAQLSSAFCYRQLASLGVVKAQSSPEERVRELQRFFGVASLVSVSASGVRRYQPAFRLGKGGVAPIRPEAVAAWLRAGEVMANSRTCAPFNRRMLEKTVAQLRSMTLQTPREFQHKLVSGLAGCGVALVIVPHFPGTKAQGATFWQGPEKAVLLLTLRGAWADVFWFSLFHELGHVLLHDQHEVFIEGDSRPEEHEDMEREADRFAADHLIAPQAYQAFVRSADFSAGAIATLAKDVGVHPGIVVGRLQHDEHLLPSWRNDLRQRYAWTSEAGHQERPTARSGRAAQA